MATKPKKETQSTREGPAAVHKFPHIEVEIEIGSTIAAQFVEKKTGFVMHGLTTFYRMMGMTRITDGRSELDDWLDDQITEALAELTSIEDKTNRLKDEVGGKQFAALTYPRPTRMKIICSHPASFAVIELYEKLDAIGIVADGLWMTRCIHRKQREQIALEGRKVITDMVTRVNKMVESAGGRENSNPDTANEVDLSAVAVDESVSDSGAEQSETKSPAEEVKVVKAKTPKKKAKAKKAAPKETNKSVIEEVAGQEPALAETA